MFDIGFSELLLFGAIALIILGPEKLPQAARTAGKWYSKARRTVTNLQYEIENELDLAETRKQMQEELDKIREAESRMQQEMAEIRDTLEKNNGQKYKQVQSNNIANPESNDESAATNNSAKANSANAKNELSTTHSSAPTTLDELIDEPYEADRAGTYPTLTNTTQKIAQPTEVTEQASQVTS